MLIPSSQWLITGIPLRWFFCRDGKKFYEKTIELFDYIKTFKNIEFVNFDDYQKILLEKNNEN